MQNHKVKKVRLGSTGSKHWNYQHGNETLAAKQERSEISLRLRYLQEIGHQFKFIGGRRLVGRKPVNFVALDFKNKLHLAYALIKINDVN